MKTAESLAAEHSRRACGKDFNYEKSWVVDAMNEFASQYKPQWISVETALPERKEGWDHSERVLVWYKGSESHTEAFGIAYYHYDPPFAKPGFTDFAHYGRKPDLWMPLFPLPSPPENK